MFAFGTELATALWSLTGPLTHALVRVTSVIYQAHFDPTRRCQEMLSLLNKV
jgi:hypothetical protein